MVVRVVELAVAPGDDTSCAAMLKPRRLYRVFAVVAAVAARQQPLEIAENDAVALVAKRSAVAYRAHRALRFGRQLRERDGRQSWSFRGTRRCASKRQHDNERHDHRRSAAAREAP